MPKGWEFLCVAPPFVAVILAIVTRRVIASLFFGILAAAVLLSYPQLFNDGGQFVAVGMWRFTTTTCNYLFESFLWKSLFNEDHLRVICFTLLMGAMVGVIHRSGGMTGIAQLFAPIAKTRLGGQMAAWLMGMVVFFDDYANTLLVGNTMRPITDRLRISREKLAYIVDTTAAPVAGLSLISTWVASEISYVDDGTKRILDNYGDAAFLGSHEGFWVICQTIPYRFYILLAIFFVPMLILLRRDFGSMLQAEKLASEGTIDPRHPVSTLDRHHDASESAGRWLNAILPVMTMVVGVIGLIIATGWTSIVAHGGQPTVWSAFPKGDSYVALVYGSLAGLAASIFLTRVQRLASWEQIRAAAAAGASAVIPALVVLWLAWSLSLSTKDEFLNTGQFLSALVNPTTKPDWMTQWMYDSYCSIVSVNMMPTLVFIVASLISFATGTSWGTMTIMTPLVVVVMYELLAKNGQGVSMSNTLMLSKRWQRPGRSHLWRSLFADFGHHGAVVAIQQLQSHRARPYANDLRARRCASGDCRRNAAGWLWPVGLDRDSLVWWTSIGGRLGIW